MIQSCLSSCFPRTRYNPFRMLALDLEIVTHDFDSGREYKDKFEENYNSVEKFNNCMKTEQKRIIEFYKGNFPWDGEKVFDEIITGLAYTSVCCRIMDFSKMKITCPKTYQPKGDSEKIYCKTVADLVIGTDILLGNEKGKLGSYGNTLNEVVEYFKIPFNPEDRWIKHW